MTIAKPAKLHEAALNPSGAPLPAREEAEAAVRVLLRWAGDDPNREG
ncbi:MAG: GTP cyclohydrolase I FolE, partial [Alphaproteobacteria bacterium]